MSERFLECFLFFEEIRKRFLKSFWNQKKSPTDRLPPRRMDLAKQIEEKSPDISLQNQGSCVVHRWTLHQSTLWSNSKVGHRHWNGVLKKSVPPMLQAHLCFHNMFSFFLQSPILDFTRSKPAVGPKFPAPLNPMLPEVFWEISKRFLEHFLIVQEISKRFWKSFLIPQEISKRFLESFLFV